jgi:hypothetical protein
MNLIPIEGLDEATLESASTAPSGGGLKPFPCDAAGWTKHTAVVMGASLKVFDSGSEAISLLVANAEYGGEILVNLPPYAAQYHEKSLETLVKTVKILGCHTAGKLDLDKLKNAHGQLVEIIAKHKGFREGKDGRQYHKVSLILTGEARDMAPVTQVAMPATPGPVAAVDPNLPF